MKKFEDKEDGITYSSKISAVCSTLAFTWEKDIFLSATETNVIGDGSDGSWHLLKSMYTKPLRWFSHLTSPLGPNHPSPQHLSLILSLHLNNSPTSNNSPISSRYSQLR